MLLSDRVALARTLAIITGVIGVLMAILTPLMPVKQSTAELNWPQAEQYRSVTAPLVGYYPISLDISLPCSVMSRLPATVDEPGSVLLATTPKQSADAQSRGLTIRKAGQPDVPADQQRIEVLSGNTLLLAVGANAPCRSIDVHVTSKNIDINFVGLVGPDRQPVHLIKEGDERPQVTGIYTDLTGPVVPGTAVHAVIDTRYLTKATVLKWAVIIIGVIATLISLAALAVLDGTDGRRHRRLLPAEWWTLKPRDYVGLGGLLLIYLVGQNSSDDGYLLTMARVSPQAGYTPNYFRWYGAPESPFGWYYSVFGWLSHISTTSMFIRLPSLVCGILVWLIISHEVLPRLGRAARNPAVQWTATFTFLAAWFPFDNGLRPEPIICLGTLLTWCSVERAIATGRTLPAAVACLCGAFSLAAGPTGLMAVAALIAGARSIVRRMIRRARDIGGGVTAWLALLAPVFAAGMFVLLVVFSNLTLRSFVDSTRMKTALGPSLHWYNEIQRYSSLLSFSGDGSIARRFAVLLMFAMLALAGAMLIRKNKIRGAALGPSRRIVGIILASILFLMATPTKFTHHFGVFAGLAPALAAIAAMSIRSSTLHARRNRTLFVALVLFVAALAFTGPNGRFYADAYGVAWSGSTVGFGPLKLGPLLLLATLATLVYAFWEHHREPYRQPAPPRPPSRRTKLQQSSIAIVAALVVLLELGTSAVAGVVQWNSYSLASANIKSLGGKDCGLGDVVEVETDPNRDVLQPVQGTLADSLPNVNGFGPQGLPIVVTGGAHLPALSDHIARGADMLTPDTDTVGGQTATRGVNGSTARLPFGLDPQRIPVVGSYQSGEPEAAYLTSNWFRLPPAQNRPLITMSVAGTIDDDALQLEYTTSTGTDPATFEVDGSVEMKDPGGAPQWRNLRIDRKDFGNATAIRIVAKDENLDPQAFLAVTPPRAPQLQTVHQYIGTKVPVHIDWTSGLVFSCLRPFNLKNGVAEIPQFRIAPDNSLTSTVEPWQDAYGGGPLGWIEVTLSPTTIPSYLAGDIGRDWGRVIRYTPYNGATPAQLQTGHQDRSGLWQPSPLKY